MLGYLTIASTIREYSANYVNTDESTFELNNNNNNNNNSLIVTPSNFIKPKRKFFLPWLIVSPAATEQRQIDVALSLIVERQTR